MVYLSKNKKAKKQIGPAPTVKASTQNQKKKPQKAKVPSQSEILKNPMLYVNQAIARFEALSKQVELQGEAIKQIATHIQSSDEKLKPLVDAIEKRQAAMNQTPTSEAMPQGGGGYKEMIARAALQQITGGGGGLSESDKMLMELGRENLLFGRYIIRATLERSAKDIITSVDADMKEWKLKRAQQG